MRLTHSLKLAAAFLATAVLGVTAASVLAGPQPSVRSQSLKPVPGTDVIDQSAPDPDGGPDWAVRVYASTSGGSCVELGRTLDGRFGRVRPGGSFQELALDERGTCGDLDAEPVILAINAYPSGKLGPARTVLFGRGSPDVPGVRVTPSGAASPADLEIGAAGGFLLPLAGTREARELPTVATLDDGRQLTHDWR